MFPYIDQYHWRVVALVGVWRLKCGCRRDQLSRSWVEEAEVGLVGDQGKAGAEKGAGKTYRSRETWRPSRLFGGGTL